MFYVWWIVLIAAALWVSPAVLIWAIQTGQFADQARARFLPLRDELPQPPVKNPSKLSLEVYALLVVIALGLLALISTVALVLVR